MARILTWARVVTTPKTALGTYSALGMQILDLEYMLVHTLLRAGAPVRQPRINKPHFSSILSRVVDMQVVLMARAQQKTLINLREFV